jgi:hypothetical protein
MRHMLSVIIVAALLVVTAVEVVAHYAAPTPVAGSISIALPSGMKTFPVELPQ